MKETMTTERTTEIYRSKDYYLNLSQWVRDKLTNGYKAKREASINERQRKKFEESIVNCEALEKVMTENYMMQVQIEKIANEFDSFMKTGVVATGDGGIEGLMEYKRLCKKLKNLRTIK